MSKEQHDEVTKLSLNLGAAAAFTGPKLYLVAGAVFLIGVVFECFAASEFHAADLLRSLQNVQIGSTLTQVSSFLQWRAASLLLLGCALLALTLTGLNIFLAWRGNPTATLFLGSIALLLGSATAMIFASLSEPISFLKAVSVLLSQRDTELMDRNLVTLVSLPKRVAETCAGCVGLAMAAVMILPTAVGVADLRERLIRLRILLYASATMLVIGVFSVRSSYAFVLSFATTVEGGAGIEGIIDGGVGMAAAFYTLALAGGYLPAAFVLGSLARRLASEAQAQGLCDSEAEFLKAHDLQISWPNQIGRIFAIGAPLLSAAIPGVSYLMSQS